MTLEEMLVYLTPFVVYGVGLFVTWVKPQIPGWAMLSVVGALSAAYTYVAQAATGPETTWVVQFLLGLLAVFIHQVRKQIQSGD